MATDLSLHAGDLPAVAASHVAGVVHHEGLTSVVTCLCGFRCAGAGADGARRAWADHLVAFITAAGGFRHYSHIEHVARTFDQIMDQPRSALDPYGYAQKKALLELQGTLKPILAHIDAERGR